MSAPPRDAAAPVSSTAKMTEFDVHVPRLEMPYAAQSNTVHSTVPTINMLPPITTTRPMGGNAFSCLPPGVSHFPVVNGVRQNPASMPYIIGRVDDHDNHEELPSYSATIPTPCFEHMDKCRYFSGFMLCYYVCTFFFVQPLLIGTLGVLTGFLGYYGARPPIFSAHVKWTRTYVWMNYIMLALNAWYLVMVIIALCKSNNSSSSDGSHLNDSFEYYSSNQVGIIIAFCIFVDFMLHVRGLQTGKQFYAELQRSGPYAMPQRAVIVVQSEPPHVV
ncbi:hypothetical protein Poli38472_009724 [Pythium oligandrum]|uniref:Uncharacterized protein n=1 Tax=Pythium oligandrum TaxID=41045 RepID=A0A8K1CG58_PYTOL|nr:hypothetical protein Poli38472_009724 [Pythium oligandrum]|eukprot:TMW62231.1 hypothetical protein Poli38472_009724 [Pythium oligandrum]